MTKVMIVDDEIMSINHLKNLLSWEDYGYQIVAETHRADRALEIFKSVLPDIVLIDIKMPIKDGLTVAKEILDLGHNVVIILISAYEDFQYAKTALGLQINNYLVKHQITQESLLKALNSAKAKLKENNEYRKIMEREYIRKIIDGEYIPATRNQMHDCFNENSKHAFLFFLLQQDNPLLVHLESTKTSSNFAVLNDEFFESISLDDGNHYICCLYLTKNVCGVLFRIINYVSRRQLIELSYNITHQIQMLYSKKYKGTLSVVVTDPIRSLTELRHAVMKKFPMLQLSYYGFRGRFITADENIKFKKRSAAWILSRMFVFESALSEKDFYTVKSILEELFYYNKNEYIEVSELNQICIWISSILAKFINNYHLTTPGELLSSDQSNSEVGYNVKSTLEWYIKMCESCINAVKSSNTLPVAGKIKRVIDYIDEHYMDDLSINEIAEKFSMSGDYFRHLFKDVMNENFIDYLNKVRVEKSKSLLLKGNYAIYEVAKMVGYSSSQYYSRVFRKYTSMSPKEFIKTFYGKEPAI